jgi:TRAP-type C4-dicarboxylate transport system permease small subunit
MPDNDDGCQMQNDAGGDRLLRRYMIEDWVAFCVFWALTFVVFMQFSSRYLGLGSASWTEEGARYLLIMLAFSGGALAVRRRSHVAMTLMHSWLPPRVRATVEILIGLANVAFYGLAAWLAWQVGVTQGVQRMASLDFPLRYVYWTIALFLAMLTVRAAIQVASDFRNTMARSGS